jgi:hypothetical protein
MGAINYGKEYRKLMELDPDNEVTGREVNLYLKVISKDASGGFLYLLQLGDTDIFKIGVSKNVDERIKQLQAKCPLPLTEIHRWYGDDYEYAEFIFHNCFSHKRIKNEWFRLSPKDIRTLFMALPDTHWRETFSRS